MHYVYAEQVRLTDGSDNLIIAISDLMYVYYIHNFMYMVKTSKFLEFVQKYFLKILTVTGSKSTATRKNQQQRVVARVIEAISNYET